MKILKGLAGLFLALCVLAAIAGESPKSTAQDAQPVAEQKAEPVAVQEVTTAPEPAALPDKSELQSFVQARFDERLKREGRTLTVEVEKCEPKTVRLVVWIKNADQGEYADLITAAGVKWALDWLIEQGRDPQADWASVSCALHMRVKGATGKDLIRPWGTSYYDFNNDGIDYRPFKM